MLKPISHILHSFLLLVLIGTYGSVIYYLKTTPSDLPANTYAAIKPIEITPEKTYTASPAPHPSAAADTGWSLLQPGLERRVIPIYDNQKQPVESLYIWRLDQKYFRMEVGFSGAPKTLETWQKETSASMVINGGYFSINNERYSADGLTILNGRAYGRSFERFGGMLAIRAGQAELRWLVDKPYDPDEPLQAALQSFPILVQPGGKLGFGPEREDHASARRTVIAQDKDGRILFMVAPQGYFTLHKLSAYLTESDLDLDIAVNLDGGGSTGLMVANPREIIPSKVLLPFVILVYGR
jgi:hypothetical protein